LILVFKRVLSPSAHYKKKLHLINDLENDDIRVLKKGIKDKRVKKMAYRLFG